MKTKCPYCNIDADIKSELNMSRRHGGLVYMEAESNGYHKCLGCGKVFKYIAKEIKGWQKVIATETLMPGGVHDGG